MRSVLESLATPLRRASVKRAFSDEEIYSEKTAQRCIHVHTKDRTRAEVDEAIEAALSLHATALKAMQDVQKAKGDDDDAWEPAWAAGEEVCANMYSDLLVAFQVLLPGAAMDFLKQDSAGNLDYSVLTMSGVEVQKPHEDLEWDEKMDRVRRSGHQGRVRDAFCAVMSAMASRKEMTWLEAYDDETVDRGYFAHALSNPNCRFRLTHTGAVPRPISLLVTTRVPFREALADMDSDGPLKGVTASMWNSGRGKQSLQFAFQELLDGSELGSEGPDQKERQSIYDVEPDWNLKQYLLGGKDAIVVDAYVCLAPRAMAASEGYGKVVQAEFINMLRDAKAEGVAVVLQIGGKNPHLLAKKVYMREAFTQYGMKCGYMRWRPNSQESWAREQVWQDRCCLAVQLP